VEAAGTVDAQHASTAPWKTRCDRDGFPTAPTPILDHLFFLLKKHSHAAVNAQEPVSMKTESIDLRSTTLLTPNEVADLLRTSRKAIYAMVERFQLPGVIRVGRRLLFREDVLLHWLGQKSTPSPERSSR
jgi:excisionase family DNA binding protein